jgi:hypothetical protein
MKGDATMKKALSLIAVASLLSATGLSSPSFLSAQIGSEMTKEGVRERARSGAERTKTRWQSLSQEEQEQLVDHWRSEWNEMTPEQQQELREKSRTGAARLKKGYRKLPEE